MSRIWAKRRCDAGTRPQSMGSTRAMASSPGVRARMAAPSRLGTAVPVAGSRSIEMVPPVKTTAMRGSELTA